MRAVPYCLQKAWPQLCSKAIHSLFHNLFKAIRSLFCTLACLYQWLHLICDTEFDFHCVKVLVRHTDTAKLVTLDIVKTVSTHLQEIPWVIATQITEGNGNFLADFSSMEKKKHAQIFSVSYQCRKKVVVVFSHHSHGENLWKEIKSWVYFTLDAWVNFLHWKHGLIWNDTRWNSLVCSLEMLKGI